jgi:hypothetical protein
MAPQRESLRHVLEDYFTEYYAELRRQLPKYAAASEQVPPFLRSHARIIFISECADGYVITHRTNPATAGDAAETFVMIADDWDRTVGDATGKDYDPYSDFDESEAPFARVRAASKGGNAPKKNWHRVVRRTFSGNSSVATTSSVLM